jgi:hypothetical protein
MEWGMGIEYPHVCYNESHHFKKHDKGWTRTISLQINSLLRCLLRHSVWEFPPLYP